MVIPKKIKAISLILKIIVAVSAAFGTVLSAYAAKGVFMSGSTAFMYFTIQSNILIALLALAGAVILIKKPLTEGVWPVIVFVGTVSITLTGAVFCFILAPTLGGGAWSVHNVLTHVVVPAAATADFLITGAYYKIRKSSVFFVIIPPGAYAVYAGIGYAAGWEFSKGCNYPYFFLNWGSPAGAFGFTSGTPYMGCVWWIMLLLLLLLSVGYVYLLIIGAVGKKIKK